jgi:hypothetical protein
MDGIFGPLLFSGNDTHLDMMPFCHIVNKLRDEHWRGAVENKRNLPTSIQGVRVRCLGDELICERRLY